MDIEKFGLPILKQPDDKEYVIAIAKEAFLHVDNPEQFITRVVSDRAHDYEHYSHHKLNIVGIVPDYDAFVGNEILFVFKEKSC